MPKIGSVIDVSMPVTRLDMHDATAIFGEEQEMKGLVLDHLLCCSTHGEWENVQYRHLIPASVDRTSASDRMNKLPWI